jgi:hypothetical protein
MTLFEFVMGMISVMLALSIAQLFSGLVPLIEMRNRIRFTLVHGVWGINLFLTIFLHWWSLWTFRDLSRNFGMFFFSLLGPSLMFFIASMINPTPPGPGERLDLDDHFENIRRVFLGVYAVMIVLFTLDGPLFGTEALISPLRSMQAAVLIAVTCGVVWKNRRVQALVAMGVLGGLSGVTVIRFFPG